MKVGEIFFEMLDRLAHDKDGFTQKDARQVAKRFDLKNLLGKRDYENFMKLGGDSRYLVPDKTGVLQFNNDVVLFFNSIGKKLNDQPKIKFLKQFRLFAPRQSPKKLNNLSHGFP